METIKVLNNQISIKILNGEEYISLTDIAKYKDSRTDYLISNWIRNRMTIEFIGLWEKINNPKFNPIEFDGIRNKSGFNSFILTPKQWTNKTNAKGIVSTAGRYGGTYAHKDIAFEFATWISVEFKLYLIKEFQKLKENEENIGWNIKREFAKINYELQTDAIKRKLIPPNITIKQQNQIYAKEADLLNVALFGMTANEWQERNKHEKGNVRDHASAIQLICLANLENLNAVMIDENKTSKERILKLNQIAIHQMKLLTEKTNIKKINKNKETNQLIS